MRKFAEFPLNLSKLADAKLIVRGRDSISGSGMSTVRDLAYAACIRNNLSGMKDENEKRNS